MSLWVVVGGQYGSEGKGKISAVIAQREDVNIAVRCGGPNSGHSFIDHDGCEMRVRHLPTAFINPQTRLLIPAGAVLDLDVLKFEIDSLGIPLSRLGVDRNAMIIEPMDKEMESRVALGERLSSTLCGVGAAAARRLMRAANVRLAGDAAETVPWLKSIITDVSLETNSMLDEGGKVLVEGTQGFGLSLFHTTAYPKATSKDTTAAAFLSEVGLSPLRVTNVVLVLRTFPIRVSGTQAGPLNDEISWDLLQRESGYPYPISEFTTVTKKLRRVGRFDWSLATRATLVNRPTEIALNCVDHFNFADRGVPRLQDLSGRSRAFIHDLEARLAVPVRYVGVGPALADVFTPKSPGSVNRRAS